MENDTGFPIFVINRDQLPINAIKLFTLCGLCSSHNEARRLIAQGGLFIDGLKVNAGDVFTTFDLNPGILRRGKKRHCQIILS